MVGFVSKDVASLCFGIHADFSIAHHIGVGGQDRTPHFKKFVLMDAYRLQVL